MSDGFPGGFDRRRFLGLCGRAALLALLPLPARAAFPGPAPQDRAIAFLNTHTGEKLTCAYRANGIVMPDALAAISHVLRDHRTGEVKTIDPHLLDLLTDIARRMDVRGPFHVISGYRSPATNAAMRREGRGVARRSYHIQGKAIDVRVPGVDTAVLCRAALREQRGGVGNYPASDFVHVDTGPVRHW